MWYATEAPNPLQIVQITAIERISWNIYREIQLSDWLLHTRISFSSDKYRTANTL